MKKMCIKDIVTSSSDNTKVTICGWIKEKRHYKDVIFLDLTDSTGVIQIVANRLKLDEMEGTHFLRHIVHESIDIAGCIKQAAFLI